MWNSRCRNLPLCKRYRIDNSKREKHTAIIDCELLTKVYINLIDQKEPSLNFISDNQNFTNENIKNTNVYSKKNHKNKKNFIEGEYEDIDDKK